MVGYAPSALPHAALADGRWRRFGGLTARTGRLVLVFDLDWDSLIFWSAGCDCRCRTPAQPCADQQLTDCNLPWRVDVRPAGRTGRWRSVPVRTDQGPAHPARDTVSTAPQSRLQLGFCAFISAP